MSHIVLPIAQVKNYVLEKLILERPLEETGPEANAAAGQPGSQQASGNGNAKGTPAFRPGSRSWPHGTKPVVEILCNDEVSAPRFERMVVLFSRCCI